MATAAALFLAISVLFALLALSIAGVAWHRREPITPVMWSCVAICCCNLALVVSVVS